jgi:hypothetical protein
MEGFLRRTSTTAIALPPDPNTTAGTPHQLRFPHKRRTAERATSVAGILKQMAIANTRREYIADCFVKNVAAMISKYDDASVITIFLHSSTGFDATGSYRPTTANSTGIMHIGRIIVVYSLTTMAPPVRYRAHRDRAVDVRITTRSVITMAEIIRPRFFIGTRTGHTHWTGMLSAIGRLHTFSHREFFC